MAKLVRDKIPQIMSHSGSTPKTHVATQEEYETALREALHLEMSEYLDSTSVEEMVDVIEVLYALAAARGVSENKVEEIREQKVKDLGSYSSRTMLE